MKKGDSVKVITGNDKGKTGKVLKSIPRSGKVVVEGVNLKKKHQRPNKRNQKGQLIERPMPIDVSNVALVGGKN